jgi:ribosomal protein S12 methylthiotransferase
MKRRTVHFWSLGCPKNQVDAEVMLGALVREGYAVTSDPSEADVLLVNTCSFIGPAKKESIEAILEMVREKERPGRRRRLVVTGCLAERYGRELAAELPEVDAFVGTGDFLRLPQILEEISPARREPGLYVGAQHVLPGADAPRVLLGQPFSAYLKVSEGCNHRCAFCIIPKIRGTHESRPVEDLVAEAEGLARRGVRELNLVAQDLTAYGRDLPRRASLAELLRALARVEGIQWIRLLYCYPNYVTPELLETIASEPKVCPYVDIPLQHGSDRILRAMRRQRSSDGLRRLVRRIRAAVPDVAIRTSFIVGFPGEREEDFEELCRFVKELEFDRVGVFRYSREENTEAAEMPEQVPEAVKARRWRRLMQIQQEISRRRNLEQVGRRGPVLVCGTDGRGRRFGRTPTQAPEIDGVVYLEGPPASPGEIVTVRFTAAGPYDLWGVIEDVACPAAASGPGAAPTGTGRKRVNGTVEIAAAGEPGVGRS